MPPRRELCRNFQQGSCRFGDRCKFIHQQQQAPKSSNPFGFSSNSQQRNPNPFGFGAQANSQQQFKPFENTWTRSAANSGVSSRQTGSRAQNPPPATHVCTDPEKCRRLMVEDYENERPLWKLSCYAHRRDGPNDLIGDVSYDELRAAAYEDARRGMALQAIMERERNLVNEKLAEFQKLLPSSPANAPPSVSSFSQLAPSLSTNPQAGQGNVFGQPNGFQSSSPAIPGAFGSSSQPSSTFSSTVNAFGNLSSFGSSSQPSSGFSGAVNAFGKPNPFGSSAQPSPGNPGSFGSSGQLASTFGANVNAAFGTSGVFGNAGQPSSILASQGSLGSQTGPQTLQSPFAPGSAAGISGNALSGGNKPFSSTSTVTWQLPSSQAKDPSMQISAPSDLLNWKLPDNTSNVDGGGDDSIWMKNDWKKGEIPETEPPQKYIY